MTALSAVKNAYKTLEKYPGGKWAFSMMFCLAAPYFMTIRPLVNEFKPGHGKIYDF
ncbi:DUF4442 domain-containing protein [archaeon]|nr:MAG: DUF4442 domain-containing protein [archaeon]